MHRVDNSKYLLFLEFSKDLKSLIPVNDEIVKILTLALGEAKKGCSGYSDLKDTDSHFTEGCAYKGVHYTDCGAHSSNCDYLLPNGMITNSLAPYYLMWYREHIPESELDKIAELEKYYGKAIAPGSVKAKNKW